MKRLSMCVVSIFLLILSGFFSSAAFAQDQGSVRGQLGGEVTDPTGAIVQGAMITITGPTGSGQRVSNESGEFNFPGLVPGFYDVKVPKDGFKGTTVQKVDLTTNAIVGAPLIVDLAPAAIVASTDGKFVYTVNYTTGLPNTGTLSVITVATDAVVVTAVPGLFGPFDIALTASGDRAYVTNFGSNNFAPYGTTVTVIDLSTFTIVADINVGIQPAGIALYHDYALVTNYNTLYAGSSFTDLTAGEGTVQVIDLRTNKTTSVVFPVGQSPANIVVSRGRALVSNYTSNTIHSFDVRSVLG